MFLRKIWWRHGKTTIKPASELTKDETDRIRLAAKRAALHRAVDMGLLDNMIDDKLPQFNPIPEGPNYIRSDK